MVITRTPHMIDQWRGYRAQHLQSMSEPLAQMYNIRDHRIMVDHTLWLDYTWAFELGFLQSSDEKDPDAYYPFFCPIYDPSCPKDNNLRLSTVVKMIGFKRTGIAPEDPITYNMKAMKRDDNWNQVNLPQLYRHINRKVDSCAVHNVFEVVLYIFYHDNVLHQFPQFHNPCDGTTPIVTPNVTPDGKGTIPLLSGTTLTHAKRHFHHVIAHTNPPVPRHILLTISISTHKHT